MHFQAYSVLFRNGIWEVITAIPINCTKHINHKYIYIYMESACMPGISYNCGLKCKVHAYGLSEPCL